MDINEGNFDLLLHQPKPVAVLFSKQNKRDKSDMFRKVGETFKNEFVFAVADMKEKEEREVGKFLGAGSMP